MLSAREERSSRLNWRRCCADAEWVVIDSLGAVRKPKSSDETVKLSRNEWTPHARAGDIGGREYKSMPGGHTTLPRAVEARLPGF